MFFGSDRFFLIAHLLGKIEFLLPQCVEPYYRLLIEFIVLLNSIDRPSKIIDLHLRAVSSYHCCLKTTPTMQGSHTSNSIQILNSLRLLIFIWFKIANTKILFILFYEISSSLFNKFFEQTHSKVNAWLRNARRSSLL